MPSMHETKKTRDQWLAGLRAGDTVLVDGDRLMPGIITRITPAGKIRVGDVLYDKEGRRTTVDAWSRRRWWVLIPFDGAGRARLAARDARTALLRRAQVEFDRHPISSMTNAQILDILAVMMPAGVNVNWAAVSGATGYKVYGRSISTVFG
jgi:hypothetical protein